MSRRFIYNYRCVSKWVDVSRRSIYNYRCVIEWVDVSRWSIYIAKHVSVDCTIYI